MFENLELFCCCQIQQLGSNSGVQGVSFKLTRIEYILAIFHWISSPIPVETSGYFQLKDEVQHNTYSVVSYDYPISLKMFWSNADENSSQLNMGRP